MSDAVVASIVTGSFGVILAVTTWFLSKGKTKQDFANALRDELRKDIDRWKTAAEGFEKKATELYKVIDELRKRNDELEEKCNSVENENWKLSREVDRLKQVLHDNNIDGF